MDLRLFAVFDSKAGFFSNPFVEQREESAIRQFCDAVNDKNPQNMWYKHPEDYSLFNIGSFDNLTGEILPSLPKSLVTASALKSFSDGGEVEWPRNGVLEKKGLPA